MRAELDFAIGADAQTRHRGSATPRIPFFPGAAVAGAAGAPGSGGSNGPASAGVGGAGLGNGLACEGLGCGAQGSASVLVATTGLPGGASAFAAGSVARRRLGIRLVRGLPGLFTAHKTHRERLYRFGRRGRTFGGRWSICCRCARLRLELTFKRADALLHALQVPEQLLVRGRCGRRCRRGGLAGSPAASAALAAHIAAAVSRTVTLWRGAGSDCTRGEFNRSGWLVEPELHVEADTGKPDESLWVKLPGPMSD